MPTWIPAGTWQEGRYPGSFIGIKFPPGGPILTPKECRSNLKLSRLEAASLKFVVWLPVTRMRINRQILSNFQQPFTGSSFFPAARVLFRLAGWFGLLPAWALLCGGLWAVPDSFANTLGMFPPFLNFQLEEDEEIHDALIVSIPVQSFGKERSSELPVEDMHRDPVVADVYFDESRSSIHGGMEVFLQETAALLKQEDRWGLRIEGHCDSRGTSAYNLARADYHMRSLAGFLQDLGISSERIHRVNFGQTPFACESGSERCQEDNLRAERIFSILAVDRFQRGCLARLRFVAGEDSDRATGYLRRSPYLQRIQLASPRLTSFP